MGCACTTRKPLITVNQTHEENNTSLLNHSKPAEIKSNSRTEQTHDTLSSAIQDILPKNSLNKDFLNMKYNLPKILLPELQPTIEENESNSKCKDTIYPKPLDNKNNLGYYDAFSKEYIQFPSNILHVKRNNTSSRGDSNGNENYYSISSQSVSNEKTPTFSEHSVSYRNVKV